MTGGTEPLETVRYLLTAEEAWPAFEEAVLDAKTRIVGGFRVFDPATKLRSEAGRKVGDDWFDLLVHVLGKGVRLDLILSDFDPIVAPDMHQLTWSSMRKFAALREAAGPDARLSVIPAMHPAEAGTMAQVALWPKVWQELHDVRDWLNDRPPEERRTCFTDLPGTHAWLRLDDEGRIETHSPSPPPLHTVSHHQKLAVIDGHVLYIGGLDLNPRRYDTKVHHRAAEETWHDVQILVTGKAAGHAEAHLDTMLDAVAGRGESSADGHGFCRTLSRWKKNRVSMAPEIVRTSIADHTMDRVSRATTCLYFETQFFRDRALADALARRAGEVPDLEVLFVLPAAPEVIAFEKRTKLDARYGEFLQAECVRKLMAAFGDRVYFASPAQRRSARAGLCDENDRAVHHGAPLIYVHAKVSVFDRTSVLVSSANLNSRSLQWDTEAGLIRDDPAFARTVLQRSLAHWIPDAPVDPDAPLVGQIREIAELDAVRQPENRSSYLLPYDVTRAEAFGMNLPVPEGLV